MKTYEVYAKQPTHYKIRVEANSVDEALHIAEQTGGSAWELVKHGAWQNYHVSEVFDG